MRVCQNCNRPLNGGRPGRRFCHASRCRVAAHRERKATVADLARVAYSLGEDATLERFYADDEFAEMVRSAADGMHGDGLPVEDLVMFANAREDGAHLQIVVRDAPLPGESDIDAAEASGDWAPMVRTAADSMRQSFPDYQPDLSEWPDVERWFYGD